MPSLRATLQLRAQHLVDTVAIQLHMIKAVVRCSNDKEAMEHVGERVPGSASG